MNITSLPPFKEYQFSPIRLKLSSTGEVFNVGIFMMDENGKNRQIKTIPSFHNIAKCLHLNDAESHDFVLEMLNNKYQDDNFKFNHFFSNSLFIDSLEWYNSELDIKNATEYLFNEIVTINHAMQQKNTIGEYTNTKIITKISNIAKSQGMKNIAFRRKNLAHKQIDTITFGNKEKIITAGEVCSPHVEGFMDQFASSSFALEQVRTSQKITALLMYLPIMEEIVNHSLKKNYNYAESYSKERGYEIVKSKHLEAYLEAIADLTKKNGGDLFSETKE